MSRTDDEINGLTDEAEAAGKVLTKEDFIFASITTLSNQVERIADNADRAFDLWYRSQAIRLRAAAASRASGADPLVAEVFDGLADVADAIGSRDLPGASIALQALVALAPAALAKCGTAPAAPSGVVSLRLHPDGHWMPNTPGKWLWTQPGRTSAVEVEVFKKHGSLMWQPAGDASYRSVRRGAEGTWEWVTPICDTKEPPNEP